MMIVFMPTSSRIASSTFLRRSVERAGRFVEDSHRGDGRDGDEQRQLTTLRTSHQPDGFAEYLDHRERSFT